MSSAGSSYSATDIITFIGVPLAVLGVLPILYNTFATLVALSKVKRMLRHSRLTALICSDVVNRVIEVELPRYAVTPCDRFTDTELYWQPAGQPSFIPGGSWTTFNWRTRAIGAKTQRLEYADQLRQPQVDVAFDELIAYLLDLGAVPDAHGWKLLRSTGLWAPTGCSLMNSPDGLHHALTIAPLDDSDGLLSLKANWSSDWTTRNFSSLPPYWIRLPPPPSSRAAEAANTVTEEAPVSEDLGLEVTEKGKETEQAPSRKESLDSIQKQANKNATSAINCQISSNGLISATTQDDGTLFSPASLQSLHIEHLRIHSGRSDGVWFASVATALGATSPTTLLWNYAIPDSVRGFARRATVPCGVLVQLGLVDEARAPAWATAHNAGEEASELFFRRAAEKRIAVQAESRMPAAQREVAARLRMQVESNQRMQDMRDRMRLDAQRREARTAEALQSPKWDTKVVAEHSLRWLAQRGEGGTTSPIFDIDESSSARDVAGAILHRMVLDGAFASSVCRVLDAWRAWADNGGMRRADLDALYEMRELFALASLLVALVRDAATDCEGTLSLDLQECLRMWKVVRLG
ncbi:hypothetical protein GGR52DRAFT_270734 [Hypoxylon sp. FL1284]|nr:hypothetical protein GGR52DRAFT_270734 [Hypoxylon sp. FL1284]